MSPDRAIIQNHQIYLERLKFFKNFGYDHEKERDFIIEKALPFSKEILDVGTGKGHLACALAKRGYFFTSVDISEEEQEIAKNNIRYFNLEKFVDFKVQDAERLSFKEGYFNTVFSVNLVHHLKNAFKVIDECLRVLSKKGKFVLSDFNKKGLAVMDKIHAKEHRVHEVSKVDLNDIEEYLRNKGLGINKSSSEFQDVLIIEYPRK